MTAAELILAELQAQRAVLTAVLSELQSWRQPAAEGPAKCTHPEEARQNLGSMGCPWVRCRACKETLSGGPS